jgi:hypothetical protein
MTASEAREQFEQLQESFLGSDGILRDRPAIARVRLEELSGSDWGITIRLQVIQATGFVHLPSDRFSVSTAWKGSVISRRLLASCPYERWAVYLDPGLGAALSVFAESLGESPATGGFDHAAAIDRYRSLSQFIEEYDKRNSLSE